MKTAFSLSWINFATFASEPYHPLQRALEPSSVLAYIWPCQLLMFYDSGSSSKMVCSLSFKSFFLLNPSQAEQ